ncbi:hypothetical protein A1OQ_14875 [Enterovibrio norvegicus FF-162]|uniref:hypothetical protein n=1 Tax=Enterovibrio norvegicus TaxID=188144 RepID=UPI0002DEA0E4|nr:hypothetical protein [Enterovibrio norvegicus]OEE87580.1 hypothetical protein A1OQ_14875 [Enterovibrio norvegicus FF-162]
MWKILLVGLMAVYISGCDFPTESMDKKFGEQNFNSAISLIELHKVRNGSYPQRLDDLEFLGDWDAIWLSSVDYKKTKTGYNLFVTKGWMSEPELELSVRFKQGLGIEESNIIWVND